MWVTNRKKKEGFDCFVAIHSGSKEQAQTYATMLWTEILMQEMVTRSHCIGKEMNLVMMGS